MISIEQIKAARALLGWTQEELASRSGVSKPSINNLERRIANPRLETLNDIQRAFEAGGVEFTEGPGVKLKSSVLKTIVYEGEDSLVRLLQDIFDTLRGTGKDLMITGVAEGHYNELGGKLVLDEIQKRVDHNIPTKLLSCEGDTNFIEPVENYRWMPKAYFPATPSYIYDNKYALLLWGPPKKVVIIENAEISGSFRQQFQAHWQVAKIPG